MVALPIVLVTCSLLSSVCSISSHIVRGGPISQARRLPHILRTCRAVPDEVSDLHATTLSVLNVGCRRVDLAPIHCVYALPLEAIGMSWPSAPCDRCHLSSAPGCTKNGSSPHLADVR